MCGFVTVYGKYGQEVNPALIQNMSDIISHRGPDDEGIYMDDNVGLGFRRLSIIDLAKGAQPLANETNDVWIVFNGEIYNYLELRTWLQERGYQFKTDSDTETILHLYEEVGQECPKFLRGMFAFAIWDKRKKLIFGARDHFGIKPLYWTETKGSIAFASEIKSLLEMDEVPRGLNVSAFGQYLTFQYVPDPDTMFANIYKVPPGHSFVVRDDRITFYQYWQADFQPDESKPFSYYVEQVKEVMEESVHKHTICDVKWGAFLSSGVDSSTIVGLLSKLGRIKTFSVGFGHQGYSELDYARRTAEYFNTEHYEYEIQPNEYAAELPALLWYQDEPVADPAAIALYFVAKLAKQQVKVVLSGEGADELFGGYNIYREPQALYLYTSSLPARFRNLLGKVAAYAPERLKGRNYLIRGSKRLEDRYFGNALIFNESFKQILLGEKLQNSPFLGSPFDVTHPIFSRTSNADDVTKMQYLDLHTWLPGNILMKADKMTMANSLELRVPFIDQEVFKIAAQIPVKYKIAGGTTKYVLRQAMSELLPAEIQSKKKLGFPVPIRVWLRGELYEWVKEIIHDAPIGHIINKQIILYLLDEHRAGKADYSRKIWTILVFALWYQIYLGDVSYLSLGNENLKAQN